MPLDLRYSELVLVRVQPLLTQEGVPIFTTPPAFEPHTLPDVPLTPHAEALKERHGCRVLNVTDRAHALHPNLLEEVRKQAADGGCGIAVSTVCWS